MEISKIQVNILRYFEQHYPNPGDEYSAPHSDDPQWKSYIYELRELGFIDFKEIKTIDSGTGIYNITITAIGLQALRSIDDK